MDSRDDPVSKPPACEHKPPAQPNLGSPNSIDGPAFLELFSGPLNICWEMQLQEQQIACVTVPSGIFKGVKIQHLTGTCGLIFNPGLLHRISLSSHFQTVGS